MIFSIKADYREIIMIYPRKSMYFPEHLMSIRKISLKIFAKG